MAPLQTDRLKKLKAQREAIEKQIKREEQKMTEAERAKDTRRKVLVGAAMMFKAENDKQFHALMMKELDGFLRRPGERELFELPPLPDGGDAAGRS